MTFEIFNTLTNLSLVTGAVTALFVSYFVALVSVAVYNLYFHALAKYPGPTTSAIFHFPHAWSKLRGTGFKDTKLLHDKYGSVVRIEPNSLSYSSAQAWKDIYGLKSDRTEIPKDPDFYRKEGAINIIVANQVDHTRLRKILANAFSDSALLEQEPLLTLYFDLLISKLKQKIDGPARGRVDIMAYYTFATFDIIGDLSLGEPFGALEGGEYHSWIRNTFEAIKFASVMRFGAAYLAGGLFLEAFKFLIPSVSAKQAAHTSFTKDKIMERLNRKTDRKDFLTYVLNHNNERGMSQEEIICNMRVLLIAGSETSATLLSGATYFLIQNPQVLHRVQMEVRTVFQEEKDITLRSVNTSSLPYLDAVIQESFRCYPSIPATLPRKTGPGGAVIDGKFVPRNTSVGVHQWSTYRSDANFASPDTFVPERWLPDSPIEFRGDNKAALQPFSLGPRVCIGKSLAYFEIRSILARVLWNFDMQIEEESKGWIEQKEFTTWDKSPLWVRLKHKGSTIGG